MDLESSAYRKYLKLWDQMISPRAEELAKETDKDQLEEEIENQYGVMETNRR